MLVHKHLHAFQAQKAVMEVSYYQRIKGAHLVSVFEVLGA